MVLIRANFRWLSSLSSPSTRVSAYNFPLWRGKATLQQVQYPRFNDGDVNISVSISQP